MLELIILFTIFLADLKAVLDDEEVYNEAAMEAFPVYNKSHMIFLEMPNRAGDVSYLPNPTRIVLTSGSIGLGYSTHVFT